MNVKDYLRASIWDFTICLILSIGLGFVNCGAFYVSTDLQCSPAALIAATAIPLLVLFFAAYNRHTVVLGGIALVAGIAIACVVAADMAGVGILAEQESNPAVFIMVMVAGTVLSFLMTRRRWLSRVWLIVTILDICFVEFMYKQGYLWALIVAMMAAAVMVIYRNYRSNLRDASTDKVSFTAAVGVALGYAAVLLGIAALIFYLVIAPLNPSAMEFKPFEKHMNYDTVQMTGVGDSTSVEDPEKNSDDTNDDQEETDQQNQDESLQDFGSQDIPQTAQNVINTIFQNGPGAALLQALQNFMLEQPILFALAMIGLVLLLIGAPFAIKKLLRRRRFNKIMAMPPEQAVQAFFLFCLKRFRILGIQKGESETLTEFAGSSKDALAEFSQNPQGVTFAHIIAMYSAVVYADAPIDEEHLGLCRDFYSTFYKAFVAKSGRIKYIFRFFRV